MPRPRVVADERERPSGVPDALKNLGVVVNYRALDVADYIVSQIVAIERKQAVDFVRSLFDGRLFDQAERLTRSYRIPVLIIEGDAQTLSSIVPNRRTLWGAQATLSLTYGIRLFHTSDAQETAELIFSLAKRESLMRPRRPLISVRKPKAGAETRAQLVAVASLPGLGPKLAEGALLRLKTVKAVFSASAAQLAMVSGIGRGRAEKIVAFLNHPYEPSTAQRQAPLGAQDSSPEGTQGPS